MRAVLGFAQAEKVAELEAWCQDQAETVLSLHDVEADEASVLRVAKAIAAQVQRASLTLVTLARGEPDTTSAPVPRAAPAAKPAKAVGLMELVEAWWSEAERTGKSESTRESYSLQLLSAEDPLMFVRKMDMEDFPFTPFSKLIRGNLEPEAKYPTAWSWVILIYIMHSFSRDEGMKHPDQSSFVAAMDCFKEMGLAPHHRPGELIKTSSKTSFKLTVPSLVEAS